MPLYEYRCSTCGNTFEVIQKFSDAPLTVHPGCGGSVERLVSAPVLQFKGSGWYVTDYAKSSGASQEGPSAGAKTGTKTGENAGAKADSKSESKADTPPAKTGAKPSAPAKTDG